MLKSSAKEIIAVEKDQNIKTILTSTIGHQERLKIIQANALSCDLTQLTPSPRQIIANLPYNIATPLLIKWLKQASSFEQLVLMFQREVTQRICASPGSKLYGRISVISQWCANCTPIMTLSPDDFYPSPAVWSEIVRITPHKQQPSQEMFNIMERLTQIAFGQRRKMLRSVFKNVFSHHLLKDCAIDPRRRGETLTIQEFDMLAYKIFNNTIQKEQFLSKSET